MNERKICSLDSLLFIRSKPQVEWVKNSGFCWESNQSYKSEMFPKYSRDTESLHWDYYFLRRRSSLEDYMLLDWIHI
jgi:hypothetical protein